MSNEFEWLDIPEFLRAPKNLAAEKASRSTALSASQVAELLEENKRLRAELAEYRDLLPLKDERIAELEAAIVQWINVADQRDERIAELEATRSWRPMETAPRDGTRVLLRRSGYQDNKAVCWYSVDTQEWQCVLGSPFHGTDGWHPLPEVDK